MYDVCITVWFMPLPSAASRNIRVGSLNHVRACPSSTVLGAFSESACHPALPVSEIDPSPRSSVFWIFLLQRQSCSVYTNFLKYFKGRVDFLSLYYGRSKDTLRPSYTYYC